MESGEPSHGYVRDSPVGSLADYSLSAFFLPLCFPPPLYSGVSVPGRKRERENLISPMRGSIREIDLGYDGAVRIDGKEQVWTAS